MTSMASGMSHFGYLWTEFWHTVVNGKRAYTQSDYQPIEIEPYPFGPDFHALFYAAVFWFVLSWGLRKLVIEPLIRRHLHTPTAERVQKCAQAAIEMIIYSAFFFFGYRVFYLGCKEWRWPSRRWWEGVKEGEHRDISPDLKFYMLFYAGRYMAGIVSVLLEHRRTDFVEMVIHHAVTVALIGLSYSYGYFRISCVIMWLLDCADPPLHIAKQFKYFSTNKDDWYQAVADAWFAVFAVSFYLTRAGMYGYVVYSVCIERKALKPMDDTTEEKAMTYLTVTLFGLQLYWCALLTRAVIHTLRTGGVDDLRSDDEGEPKDEGGLKKKRA